MKRSICFLLILTILFSLSACNNQTIKNPLSFYFIQRNYSFGMSDSVIAAEIIDSTEFTNISKVLHFYLRGPEDPSLKTPFPPGTYLLDAKTTDNRLIVTLSDSFAKLTGISLTLACCALAKTAISFSGVESVEIQTVSALLDGEKSITINQSDLIFYDSCPTPVGNAE